MRISNNVGWNLIKKTVEERRDNYNDLFSIKNVWLDFFCCFRIWFKAESYVVNIDIYALGMLLFSVLL